MKSVVTQLLQSNHGMHSYIRTTYTVRIMTVFGIQEFSENMTESTQLQIQGMTLS